MEKKISWRNLNNPSVVLRALLPRAWKSKGRSDTHGDHRWVKPCLGHTMAHRAQLIAHWSLAPAATKHGPALLLRELFKLLILRVQLGTDVASTITGISAAAFQSWFHLEYFQGLSFVSMFYIHTYLQISKGNLSFPLNVRRFAKQNVPYGL